MKLINKTLAFLSLVSLSLASVEAKTLEFLLDHKTQETFNLNLSIPEQRQETPNSQASFLHYCQQLKIENLGDHPVKNCFPYINQSPTLSLKALGKKLAKEQYPLLALYQLWNRSIAQNETIDEQNSHPLDLLNFKGICSRAAFNEQFLKLCNAIGIETRLANVQGQELYDFGLDEEWNFLDLNHQQLYLGLDNETLASSEDVMDDPFLALRTKHARQAQKVDFKEAWKQLANFDILEPASAMPVALKTEKLSSRASGFDLFPGESLIFETPAIRPELAQHERSVAHSINLDARQVDQHMEYVSPFPIHELVNNSTVCLNLLDQTVKLLPGESYFFSESNLFRVQMTFSDKPKGQLVVSGTCAWTLFPSLTKGENKIHLRTKKNPSLIRFQYEVDDEIVKNVVPAIRVCNETQAFDYKSPAFLLESSLDNVETIWWQIALDSQFQVIPANFDQVESFTSVVNLPAISETFLNPGTSYYFRAKGYRNGQWSEWSTPFTFVVNKPDAVEGVEFEQINGNEYELNWERYAEQSDEPIEYYVFGSNALDFIPSIYCEKQVNAIVDGEVTEEETNDNLIAITTEPKVRIQSGLAYYRIIAKQHGQFAVPSKIIHVYDQDLIQPRNVLQFIEDENRLLAKRQLIPASYPWSETSLPHLCALAHFEDNISKLQTLLRSATKIDQKSRYQYEFPEVSEEIWKEVRPYLLPENHPAWPKLTRIFCNTRATLNPEEFKRAGFRRWRPGRWSRVAASSHPECQEYFIKAYCDSELGILYDWKKWIHRIKGAQMIRKCIKDNNLQANFKVPHKWIWPLPKRPSIPNSSRYLRKNFILICENMRIHEHSKNEKMYKKMPRKLLEGLYTIYQTCGLYDSVYPFNTPFCKDGRMAVIDTEYHHKWPVPYHKLTKYFAKDLRSYWERLTYKGGRIPDGVNEPNPPRMDRRDVKPKI